MQKGDIQGPPYSMPDGIELTFLRKFIERHNAGIPHNPRLRNGNVNDWPTVAKDDSMISGTPEPSESSSANATDQQMQVPAGESRTTNEVVYVILITRSHRCSNSTCD
jgi:hypothetical protein